MPRPARQLELPFNHTIKGMSTQMAKPSAKASIVRVNFTGVETVGFTPSGEYITAVDKVTKETADSGNDYLRWELLITDGKHKGKRLYNNTSLAQQSLWATKRFLECLGVELEDGELELDLEDMKDLQIGVVVTEGTWKGKPKSEVSDVFPVDDENTDPEPADSDESTTTSVVKETPAKKKAVADALPTADDVAEMGKNELSALVEKHDLDVELTGTTSAQRRAVVKALASVPKPAEPDGDIEEEVIAVEKKAATKKKPVKVKVDDVQSADEETLGELIETHELGVDLAEHATMRRKRSAVIDALEEAELLEEDE